ncbi:unnamed protein product, partial [marine sediment metagenome]
KHDACLLLDPDCVPSMNLLDHARKIFDPSILFTGWIWYIDKNGDIHKEASQTGSQLLGKSRWIDINERGCYKVLGGCMYFSKQRATLTGLFNTEYNGTWGQGEHDFALACYHSGMRLRFEAGLQVKHLYHEANRPGNYETNQRLLTRNMIDYRDTFNYLTPYNPAVAVLVVTMMRPYYIDQVMSYYRRLT